MGLFQKLFKRKQTTEAKEPVQVDVGDDTSSVAEAPAAKATPKKTTTKASANGKATTTAKPAAKATPKKTTTKASANGKATTAKATTAKATAAKTTAKGGKTAKTAPKAASAKTVTRQCAGTTKSGAQCKRAPVGRSKYCAAHKN